MKAQTCQLCINQVIVSCPVFIGCVNELSNSPGGHVYAEAIGLSRAADFQKALSVVGQFAS